MVDPFSPRHRPGLAANDSGASLTGKWLVGGTRRWPIGGFQATGGSQGFVILPGCSRLLLPQIGCSSLGDVAVIARLQRKAK